jgi:hypothetical protein
MMAENSTKVQQRVLKALEGLKQVAATSNIAAVAMAKELEYVLDILQDEDFFGTEGQDDPRGDFREGVWTMQKMQGVDG